MKKFLIKDLTTFLSLSKTFKNKVLKIVTGSLICLTIIGIFAEDTEQIKTVKTPEHSNIQAGRIYQDVVKDFKDHGFTNIKTKAIDDLIVGWLTKDGEVKSVSVDGNIGYLTNDLYPSDVEVIVTYHTFPMDEENVIKTNAGSKEYLGQNFLTVEEELKKLGFNNITVEPEITYNSNSMDNEIIEIEINGMEFESNKTFKQSDNVYIKYNQLGATYTSENCKDLNNLLKDDDISIAKDFAQKYHDEIIQFEGNIADMTNHDTYATRFDFLIYENTHEMIPFKFSDYNYFDLNLIGENIPNKVSPGQNYIVTAKVIEYNPISGLFFLDPVSLEYIEKTL
ncbi:MAG: hypothetical protein ATN32_01005 [Candidatus Epulonipiscium fishelsonii]|nr:MAG: hypothetical protein ATN32_01005 [Epulopiscium sp. AS2M-Bin002]